MLTQHATLRIQDEDTGRDIEITPLFLQNHAEPWDPNEIFDLAQSAILTDGEWKALDPQIELGKIIVDDKKEWHYEGDGEMSDDDMRKIIDFVMAGE